ncbi:FimV/HubP family polar landmark protein [Paludibacterium yongneupense]|uniref:FimV/HubP family polar landmark protein n=1 Tax=Paludibacterium yongneupense TaxID=400061 RepID=UPI00041DD9A2|nr:FimV/HubP family polar landmark protein [Paludibacterium yongneupense]
MVPVKLRFAVALLILLLSAQAWAALGKLHVRSHLGEPFSGEIALTDMREADLSALKVGLAGRPVFKSFNIDYVPVLETLRFSVTKTAHGASIRLSSQSPVAEPYLHFVLEARTGGGVQRREYIVLLDPPADEAASAPLVAETRRAVAPSHSHSHSHARHAVRPAPVRPASAPVARTDLAPAVPVSAPVPAVQAVHPASAPLPASAPRVDEARLLQLRGKVDERERALKQERSHIAELEQQLKALESSKAPPPWWRSHWRQMGVGALIAAVLFLLTIWIVKRRRSHAAAKTAARPKRRDLIAEAEALLAQGEEMRAEDLLKEAMLYESSHQDARQRLLDLYAARPDTVRFEVLAREVHALYDGRGAAWQRVAAQGSAIDPENPLYQPGSSVPPAVAPLREAVLEMDGLDSGGFAPAAPPVPEPAAFDLSDSMMTAPVVPTAADKGNDMLDFDFAIEKPATPSPATAAAPVAEMAFEMPPDDFAEPAKTAVMPMRDEAMDAGSTKLDLARVYLDMGDRDGAREVLGDLIRESQGELKEQAEALLASIV